MEFWVWGLGFNLITNEINKTITNPPKGWIDDLHVYYEKTYAMKIQNIWVNHFLFPLFFRWFKNIYRTYAHKLRIYTQKRPSAKAALKLR